MCEAVLRLLPQEYVFFDKHVLEGLCLQMGDAGAEAYIEDTLRLNVKLVEGLVDNLEAWDYAAVCEQAYHLAQLSHSIGMETVHRVALDALRCARQENKVALHAVIARLSRLSNSSAYLAAPVEDVCS